MEIDTIQIHLNSKYATSYNDNSTSDCNFLLPIIEIPAQYSLLLSVQHAVIPYSFYNVNASNNMLTIQEIIVDANGNQTGVITNSLYISQGTYNATQLAKYLGTLFVGGRISVTYNQITNKFVFANTTYNFKFLSAYCTCQDLLGLSENDLYNTSVLKSLTSRNLINLAPIKCICLASNLQTGCINNNLKNEMNIICSIPVDSQPFSIITYKNSSNFKVNLHTNVLNFITIRLIDDAGNKIDLNGQDFSLTLQLEAINFVE